MYELNEMVQYPRFFHIFFISSTNKLLSFPSPPQIPSPSWPSISFILNRTAAQLILVLSAVSFFGMLKPLLEENLSFNFDKLPPKQI
jgi:hypothetical protein